ncbi:malto-oligosyltrehalose synthase [Acetobacter conturbans]|uniref:Malto-oligosyltrehalose synthase n=1 Tax=Acetobacter conturbans TaxID=1737472 RepID=A0ABX0K018_9PROT|nr:malto-oligosyltrehalose synthase [Acetobacter conturbans]NHN89009.1 malto-oligosyltrehalose synthase [Acetobacter conturbans]
MSRSRPALRATVRLQFRQGFTLDHACKLVPYFAELGVSHIYASPLLTSTPGSTHGYDILDYSQIDPAVGGEAALRRLAVALQAHDMGLILDIVPNHMAVGGAGNRWWEHVLAWGISSPYAEFFDIAWNIPAPSITGRVLLPFLDRPFGEALLAGALILKYDHDSALFFIHHHEHRFPVSPVHYGTFLRNMDMPSSLSAALSTVADRGKWDEDCQHTLRGLAVWLQTSEGQDVLTALSMRFSAAHQPGREQLQSLIARQHWVATWWRTASEIINWRRFFDNTSLGALCVEREAVFTATHRYVLVLLEEGLIDGLRIDHIDGLTAPAAYCHRLRQQMEARGHFSKTHISIHVEKITISQETLPTEWDVDGTTGYDFMEQVSALLHDAHGSASLDTLWAYCRSEVPMSMAETALTARKEILPALFTAEFDRLIGKMLLALREASYSASEVTEPGIRKVTGILLCHFLRYRTYYADSFPLDHTADLGALMHAVAQAREDLPSFRHALLDRIAHLLTAHVETFPSQHIRDVQRAFEHLTAPLAAKSLEDTAFYRNVRLISRNEVGSHPDTLGLSVVSFHDACLKRQAAYPRAMLATATHDHKRGEDSRMRIAVLSEVAESWSEVITQWLRDLPPATGPDTTDALMLYQTLLGVWPLDGDLDEVLHCRVSTWLTKALREGKRHTSWLDPNESYEGACQDYLTRLFDSGHSSRFQTEMSDFLWRIAPSAALNSLSQTLLRLTTPGIPDLYQGCELWDFSLVDPDNRRPVDYERRALLLANLPDFDKAATTWKDGTIKFRLIQQLLTFRKQHPGLFLRGAYHPIAVNSEHVVAFLRVWENRRLLVLAPRHTHAFAPDVTSLAFTRSPEALVLPDACHGRWRSLLHTDLQREISSNAILPFLPGMVPLECLISEE